MAKKAVVLSSGGVDSTTCVAAAVNLLGKENVTTLSFNYGQKHLKELQCAAKIAKFYDVRHKVLNLQGVGMYDDSDCTLLTGNKDIPEGSYNEQVAGGGRVSTNVPFRNGIMISCAIAYAMSIYPEEEVSIYLGAHQDDVAGNIYPDCSIDFVRSMNTAAYWGSGELVNIEAPFVYVAKKDIIKMGIDLGVPYELTWSCYSGNIKPCCKCGTCIDRQKAFEANGIIDPLLKGDLI